MGRPISYHPLPSDERLKELLEIDAEGGTLTWKERMPSSFPHLSEKSALRASRQWNGNFAGERAGSVQKHSGYRTVFIDGVGQKEHRIIWKMATGEDPMQIDHINGNVGDNRLINLRNVTHQVNAKNRKLYSVNTSGFNGVSFHSRDGVWMARAGVGGGKEIHLGNYDTREEAIAARFAADLILEYHENHGKERKVI